MKNSNRCAKCSGTELLRIPSLPGEEPHLVVGDHVMHEIPVTKFVCAKCGYMEQWVENPTDLAKLSEEYGRR